MPKAPCQDLINDFGLVYDSVTKLVVNSWQNQFKRFLTVVPVFGILFNSTAQVYTSKAFHVEPFKRFSIFIALAVSGTPTDIYYDIEFSDNQQEWYKYITGPFGDLRYEDSAGAKNEYLVGDIVATWMKIKITSSGCSASATFTTTVKVNLES